MTGDNLTRTDAQRRAAEIRLHTAEVSLDVRDAARAAETTFRTRAILSFDARVGGETWVDFLGSTVDAVTVNGESRPVEWDGARIRIDGLAAANVVVIEAQGVYSRSGEGLHRFVDPVDGAVYLYTQYEPADARRVYPCFEQPDLKARWRMLVRAPHGWQVLSNGVETDRREIDRGVEVRFAETPPISSYITAVAAGPYHRVDASWDGPEGPVALGVLCRSSLADHLDAEEIVDITRRGLDYFGGAFGLSYPWGKYDQIFVPEYNLGAMENPGLVTFTESYVFRGAATTAQHAARANTVLHEMAHMWFGDLVTMRWWDDLWLKESFADFMGSHASVATGLYPDAWVSFASRRKGWAYEQDQLPTTHPIVADIPDLQAAKLNFDGITYAKGASVLKQLVAYVGEDAFFAGTRRYFADHAYGNTSLDDLLRALEQESGRDLREWSREWLLTTGMSDLAVVPDGGGDAEVVLTDPRPHRVTIGRYTENDGRLERRDGVGLDLTSARTPLPGGTGGGAGIPVVIPNDDDRTYAKVRLDVATTDALERGLSTIADPLARSVAWAALWNAARDGELGAERYIGIVARHATSETHIGLLADAVAHAGAAAAHYVAPDRRTAVAARWLETAWAALAMAEPGSDGQLVWARTVGAAATAHAGRAVDLRGILSGDLPAPAGLVLDADLRWAWLFALATTGAAAEADIDAELTRDDTSTGRLAHRAALAARPDAGVRRDAWTAAWSDGTLSNDELDATISGIRSGGRRDLIAALDADYYARIADVWGSRSIEIARRLVRGLFPFRDDLTMSGAWLEAHPDAPAALRRIVVEQQDALARAHRVQRAQSTLA
ncbi:aminopeptidase N [Microbacterium radiodurans]|uniref:Aminopeptidase N n=1 Tax=Microbacterium radiodurans TaxID=661398 RepID=A0A5J5IQW5_9MICO|nr:aminopeptidase N [Microbacterium radiodurans]KAA9087036.1 aminopeptidase N [Microbacterium radiodurans]